MKCDICKIEYGEGLKICPYCNNTLTESSKVKKTKKYKNSDRGISDSVNDNTKEKSRTSKNSFDKGLSSKQPLKSNKSLDKEVSARKQSKRKKNNNKEFYTNKQLHDNMITYGEEDIEIKIEELEDIERILSSADIYINTQEIVEDDLLTSPNSPMTSEDTKRSKGSRVLIFGILFIIAAFLFYYIIKVL